MGFPGRNRIAASVVLAAVTLSVFAVLRDYGPESAVRRFHQGIYHGDRNQIAQVLTQDLGSSASLQLLTIVSGVYGKGYPNYRVARFDANGDRGEMLVIYEGKMRMPVPVVFVLRKREGKWLIDPFLTMQTFRGLVPK